MSKLLKPWKDESGSALLAVLALALIIALSAGSVGMTLKQDALSNKTVVDRIKARQVADGAAQKALAMIADDFDRATNPTSDMQSGTLGDGTYAVDIQTISGNIAVILADGTVGDRTERVKVFFRLPVSTEAFDKAMFAEGDMNAAGNGDIGNSTHSNSNSTFRGNITVDGDADSVGTTSTQGNVTVTGNIGDGQDEISYPILDFDYYYDIAQSNGEVYTASGKFRMKNQTYSPSGGVMWVVGDVEISGTTTINGAVFATGDIKQAGNCTLNQQDNLPALVSRDGDITLRGNGANMSGLFYAASGAIDVAGNHSSMTGALVAWNEVRTRGNFGVINYSEQNPETEGAEIVEILAWQ